MIFTLNYYHNDCYKSIVVGSTLNFKMQNVSLPPKMKLKVKPTIGKSLCIIVAIVSTSPKGID